MHGFGAMIILDGQTMPEFRRSNIMDRLGEKVGGKSRVKSLNGKANGNKSTLRKIYLQTF